LASSSLHLAQAVRDVRTAAARLPAAWFESVALLPVERALSTAAWRPAAWFESAARLPEGWVLPTAAWRPAAEAVSAKAWARLLPEPAHASAEAVRGRPAKTGARPFQAVQAAAQAWSVLPVASAA
jgi:hypothetical protein